MLNREELFKKVEKDIQLASWQDVFRVICDAVEDECASKMDMSAWKHVGPKPSYNWLVYRCNYLEGVNNNIIEKLREAKAEKLKMEKLEEVKTGFYKRNFELRTELTKSRQQVKKLMLEIEKFNNNGNNSNLSKLVQNFEEFVGQERVLYDKYLHLEDKLNKIKMFVENAV